MDVTLAVLADFASVSADGKLNIMGIFDEVAPASFPAQILSTYLVAHYEADVTEVDRPRRIRVELVDPDGNKLFSVEQSITVPRRPAPRLGGSFNHIARFAVLQFPAAGDYQFAILIDDDHKQSIRLRVNPLRETPEGS